MLINSWNYVKSSPENQRFPPPSKGDIWHIAFDYHCQLTLKKVMFRLGILIFLASCFFAQAENPCGIMSPSEVKNWGQGFLYVPENVCIDVCDVNGEVIYEVQRVKVGVPMVKLWMGDELVYTGSNIDLSYIASYEMPMARIFHDFRDERFFRVFPGFSDTLLISFEVLRVYGVELLSSLNVLKEDQLNDEVKRYANWAKIGVNEMQSCLNLRTEPNLKSEVISCIKSNDWITDDDENAHFKILEWKDNWARVEVNVHALKPDAETECDFELKSTLKGWIKAVDDKQVPNIWYSVTGY